MILKLLIASLIITMPLAAFPGSHRICDYVGNCPAPPAPAKDTLPPYTPQGRFMGFTGTSGLEASKPPKGLTDEALKRWQRVRLGEIEAQLQQAEHLLTGYRKLVDETETKHRLLLKEREALETSLPTHLAPAAPQGAPGKAE